MRILACLLFLLVGALPLASQGAVRWQDAETWVANELAPAVARTLSEHPRFRGQTIRVVAFENGEPAARSNALALGLRDQLSAALLHVRGIRMAAPPQSGTRIDCTLADVDYFIGLEATRSGSGLRLDLRTLDVRNNTWVTGFDMRWQGALSSGQRRQLREVARDPWFQGRRSAPYDVDEADVLARKLAYDLACAAMRQLGGEYVVLIEPGAAAGIPGITELIANNLTNLVSMPFTSDPERANAVLRAKTHAVDRQLGQFWATLAPIDGGTALPALTASAYIRLPIPQRDVAVATDAPQPATGRVATRVVVPAIETESTPGVLPTSPANPAVALPPSRRGALMSASLVVGGGRGLCRGMGKRCAALEMRGHETAAVFLLNHQPRHGMVRLAGDTCRKQSAPRVLHADASVTVALPVSARDAVSAPRARTIALRPHTETWYALAVSDSRAALAFSRHLQALPQRCSSASRFGLRDEALAAWLERFAQMIETWSDDVDLRAVHARAAS